LITLAAVIAFGPEKGFVFALSGILIAAFATYAVGLLLPEATVHRIAGPRLPRIAETLRRRGLLAITALRLVPIAPFAIEGVVAAAIG
ncbi:VTT domain-containing protein, partial [Salmonella enterica subsp. enterica serovar Typhimurium]|nr:VTT domain-containing protein [Salmonella enterica subsp. enterica serovar Typhimurium]